MFTLAYLGAGGDPIYMIAIAAILCLVAWAFYRSPLPTPWKEVLAGLFIIGAIAIVVRLILGLIG